MRLSSLFTLLSLLILTVACGKGGSGSKKYATFSQEEIAYIMDNQSMSCDSISGSCPRGITRLFIVNPKDARKSGVCSGFMVSSTTVVTNNHCVEDQQQCDNTYISIYDGAYNSVQTKCKNVIRSVSDYSNPNDSRKKLDYAVLEIEDSFSTFLPIASSRASVGDTAIAWVVDHTGLEREGEDANLFESRVTQFNCTVEERSETRSIVLRNCPAIDGNSGSAVTNTSGQVTGVLWGATEPKVSSLTPLNTRRAGTGRAVVTEMIYFQDFI